MDSHISSHNGWLARVSLALGILGAISSPLVFMPLSWFSWGGKLDDFVDWYWWGGGLGILSSFVFSLAGLITSIVFTKKEKVKSRLASGGKMLGILGILGFLLVGCLFLLSGTW